MGGKSSGSSDPSGMYAAMASAQAAQMAYSIGEQQLAWSESVWNQEQPLINAAESADITLAQAQTVSMEQMQQEAAQQWQMYQQYYAPLEAAYVSQAENWASPENVALVSGQAQANVAEQTNAAISSAKENLMAYGVNPDAGRFQGTMAGLGVMGAASEAGAGTMASQNLKLQQLALEQGAINTGRGTVNATGQLTGAGTGAGQAGVGASTAGAGTAQSNLATGSQAFTNAANWFNTGASNMGVYVNAVNGYNQTQVGFAQVGAEQAMGMGSLAGGILGDITGMISPFKFAAKGGPIEKFDAGGPAIPPDPWAQSRDRLTHAMAGGGPSDGGSSNGNAEPSPNTRAIPSEPVPSHGTPGGYVHHAQSPSGGRHVDDVPARLSAGEFVMPVDVVEHLGKQHFYNVIDKSRKQQAAMDQRDDVGGESGSAIPQTPTFVSVPQHMRQQGALPV